jgi:hypothetical protein
VTAGAGGRPLLPFDRPMTVTSARSSPLADRLICQQAESGRHISVTLGLIVIGTAVA